jgi:hypothetical protein
VPLASRGPARFPSPRPDCRFIDGIPLCFSWQDCACEEANSFPLAQHNSFYVWLTASGAERPKLIWTEGGSKAATVELDALPAAELRDRLKSPSQA